MDKKKEFVSLYEYIQLRLLGFYQSLNLSTNKNRILVENFLRQVDFDLWEFLVFQFAFKYSKRSRFRIPPLCHIIGEKALKRWKERTSEQIFMVNRFVQDIGLYKPSKREDKINGVSESYLDEQRNKFFSTPRGFIHCQSYGTLFDNEKCKECKYNYICKGQ